MTKTTKVVLVLAVVGVGYWIWKKNSSKNLTTTTSASTPSTTASTTASFSGYPVAKEAKFANASGKRFQ